VDDEGRTVGSAAEQGGTKIAAAKPPFQRPRLLIASTVVAAPAGILWLVSGRRSDLVSLVGTAAILAANVALTRSNPAFKRGVVRLVQKYLLNPPVRILVSVGVLPLGYALLETTGRVSGQPRRVPVGNGLVGDTFWIVAEHGHGADYVRNIQRDPRVRVKVRVGLRPVWREGVAQIDEADDPHDRQRALGRHHPLRALKAAFVRVLGTDLLTVRIDLSPTVATSRWPT
jgi:deazaflavin-dependent oxidoreductase (nitroreductase family)